MKTTMIINVFAAIAVMSVQQFSPCRAAPRKPINTYDQRQDGKLNVHAKLENSLFVFVPSSSTGSTDLASLLQNDIVAQVLELKNVAPRVKNRPEAAEFVAKPEEPSEIAVETPGVRITNPEIGSAKPELNKDGGLSVKLIAIVQRDLSEDAASSQSPSTNLKNDKNLKNSLENQGEGIEAIAAGETGKNNGKVGENSDKPSDYGPGELRLIGDSIENCGPERCRNSSGICEFCDKE